MKTEVNKRLDGLIFYEQGKGYNGYSVNIASLAGKSMGGVERTFFSVVSPVMWSTQGMVSPTLTVSMAFLPSLPGQEQVNYTICNAGRQEKTPHLETSAEKNKWLDCVAERSYQFSRMISRSPSTKPTVTACRFFIFFAYVPYDKYF